MTYAMVAYYGMSKKIGPISYYDSTGTRDTFTKPFSEETARSIDDEVRRILEEAYACAREIIETNNDKINAMADLLLEKETIYAEDIEPILGPSAQSQKAKAEKAEEMAKGAEKAAEETAKKQGTQQEQKGEKQSEQAELSQAETSAEYKAEPSTESSEGVTISPEEPMA